MWGNTLGWILSALIVIAMACGLAYIVQSDEQTPPTALTNDSRNLAALSLAEPTMSEFGALAPAVAETPAEAAADFEAAIAAYQANPTLYDHISNGRSTENFDELPAIAPLLRAANSSTERGSVPVLTSAVSEVITLRPTRPPLEAIVVLGDALIAAGLNHETDDPVGARRYFAAAFQLGDKLFRERLVFGELLAGTNLMASAAIRFAKMSSGNGRVAAACRQFDAAYTAFFQQRINPTWAAIATIDPGVISQHAGDVFVFARKSNERLWRIEACFALARFRFAAPHPRDRAAARKVLQQIADTDADPFVNRAAAEGLKMTVEDYRMLR